MDGEWALPSEVRTLPLEPTQRLLGIMLRSEPTQKLPGIMLSVLTRPFAFGIACAASSSTDPSLPDSPLLPSPTLQDGLNSEGTLMLVVLTSAPSRGSETLAKLEEVAVKLLAPGAGPLAPRTPGSCWKLVARVRGRTWMPWPNSSTLITWGEVN